MRTSEQHKQNVVKYLENCSKHTFQKKNGDYFFIRLSEDRDSYTVTTGSYVKSHSITEDLKYCSINHLKCLMKQSYFKSEGMKSIRRTKPIRRFVEGDLTIHIPEQYLQKVV